MRKIICFLFYPFKAINKMSLDEINDVKIRIKIDVLEI